MGTEIGSQFLTLPQEVADAAPQDRLALVQEYLASQTAVNQSSMQSLTRMTTRALAAAMEASEKVDSSGPFRRDEGTLNTGWYFPVWNNYTDVAGAGNEGYFRAAPWIANASGMVDKLAFYVTVAGSTGATVDVGVYKKEGGIYTKIFSKNVAATTTGVQEVTFGPTFRVTAGEELWLGLRIVSQSGGIPTTLPTIRAVSTQQLPIAQSDLSYGFANPVNGL